jgi:hypothetical protein
MRGCELVEGDVCGFIWRHAAVVFLAPVSRRQIEEVSAINRLALCVHGA